MQNSPPRFPLIDVTYDAPAGAAVDCYKMMDRSIFVLGHFVNNVHFVTITTHVKNVLIYVYFFSAKICLYWV